MKNLKKILISSVVVVMGLSMVSFNLNAQAKPWTVPANYKSMKNPVAKGDASNKAGMALYTRNCASCHGKAGMGNYGSLQQKGFL